MNIDLGEVAPRLRDWRQSLIVAGAVTLVTLMILPRANVPFGDSYPVFAIVISLAMAAFALTGVLMWAQSLATRSVPLALLSMGFALTAVVMAPYLLCFRGVWPEFTAWISADARTSIWLWTEWHLIFVCSVLGYQIARRTVRNAPDEAAFARWRHRLVAVSAALVLATVPLLVRIDGLPRFSIGGEWTLLANLTSAIILALAVAGIVVSLYRNAALAILDLWLSVALLAIIADLVLSKVAHGPFAQGWYASRLTVLVAGVSVLVVLLFQTARLYAHMLETADRLRTESLTDKLTGLANRRGFDQRFEQELSNSLRENEPLALMMVDVDNFKVFNDAFGHPAGDECLCIIARTLRNNVSRPRDFVARYGGEEMIVIMPGATLAGATTIAERIRYAVEAYAMPQGVGATHPMVTISVGVSAANLDDPRNADMLILDADRALYRAKNAGRNAVVAAGEAKPVRLAP